MKAQPHILTRILNYLLFMWYIDYSFVCFVENLRYRVYVLINYQNQEVRRYYVREDA